MQGIGQGCTICTRLIFSLAAKKRGKINEVAKTHLENRARSTKAMRKLLKKCKWLKSCFKAVGLL